MVLYLQKAAKNKVVYALDNFIYKKLIKIVLIHCILLLNHNNSTSKINELIIVSCSNFRGQKLLIVYGWLVCRLTNHSNKETFISS